MGYDIIFAQIGWNHTIEQDIALLRGAAILQNKSWGTIITWKYNNPPYLDTAENIYNQMRTSYEAGAEYIVIFNYPTYPEENQFGVMTDAHFEALEKFWNDIVTNPAWFMAKQKPKRRWCCQRIMVGECETQQDTIWALWGPDEKSEQIWNISRQLLAQYGTALDIVYDDPEYPVTGKYQQIILLEPNNNIKSMKIIQKRFYCKRPVKYVIFTFWLTLYALMNLSEVN